MKRYDVSQMDKDGGILDDTTVQAADVWEATCLTLLDGTRYPTTEWINIQIHDKEDEE